MITNDIPAEAVIPYLVKQRNGYKAKLDYITPYTKSLEAKVKALEKKVQEQDGIISELRDAKSKLGWMRQIEQENERMKKELKALRKDYKSSDWYLQKEGELKRLRKKIGEMRMALNRLLVAKNLAAKEVGYEAD